MENESTLEKRRRKVAENFWNSFDIPNGIQIETADGFEHSSGSNIFSRTVYFYDLTKENTSTEKTKFEIIFLDKTTAITSAQLGLKKINIPNRFSATPSFGIRTKEEITDKILNCLIEVEELGKMLDMEMEDGNFHPDIYESISKMINNSINSLESIKEND